MINGADRNLVIQKGHSLFPEVPFGCVDGMDGHISHTTGWVIAPRGSHTYLEGSYPSYHRFPQIGEVSSSGIDQSVVHGDIILQPYSSCSGWQ